MPDLHAIIENAREPSLEKIKAFLELMEKNKLGSVGEAAKAGDETEKEKAQIGKTEEEKKKAHSFGTMKTKLDYFITFLKDAVQPGVTTEQELPQKIAQITHWIETEIKKKYDRIDPPNPGEKNKELSEARIVMETYADALGMAKQATEELRSLQRAAGQNTGTPGSG